jgi:hypothetical protein
MILSRLEWFQSEKPPTTQMKKLLDFLFPFRTRKTSLLALSIQTFTDETHLEQIFRQGRVYEYSYKARYSEK